MAENMLHPGVNATPEGSDQPCKTAGQGTDAHSNLSCLPGDSGEMQGPGGWLVAKDAGVLIP